MSANPMAAGARGSLHQSAGIANVVLTAKLRPTSVPIGSSSWCHGIAHVDLERDALPEVHVVAERVAQVRGEGDPAPDPVVSGSGARRRPARCFRAARTRRNGRPTLSCSFANTPELAERGVRPQAVLPRIERAHRAVDQVVDADEIGHEAVGRPLVQLLRRPDLEASALG